MEGGGIIICMASKKHRLILFFEDYKLVLWGYM